MKIIDRLKKHILVDGFHVIVDPKASTGSWIVDAETGKRYLDCYSQFASQALGWNHPALLEARDRFADTAMHKLANSDMYCEDYCRFVEAFAEIVPDFRYKFFIEGGALGVENALKAAFDWKAQCLKLREPTLNVAHFKRAFHGRTGYTLSLTNTDSNKTMDFPKFDNWTRLPNPTCSDPSNRIYINELESHCLEKLEVVLQKNKTAAVIIETIQGEGGDNHFRTEFFKGLRELVDRYETMLIFDEVQCGMGLTGRWWAYQHHGVIPDMMCFGKKAQVCGFCATEKIDNVPSNVFHASSRINSTWGGNIVDMVRSEVIIRAIQQDNLVENAEKVGAYFMEGLKDLEGEKIQNVRGKGLMIAFDLEDTAQRDAFQIKLQNNMLALRSGEKSIRFRPVLTFTQEDAETAIRFVKEALN